MIQTCCGFNRKVNIEASLKQVKRGNCTVCPLQLKESKTETHRC